MLYLVVRVAWKRQVNCWVSVRDNLRLLTGTPWAVDHDLVGGYWGAGGDDLLARTVLIGAVPGPA